MCPNENELRVLCNYAKEGGDENGGPVVGRLRGHWMQSHWKNNIFPSCLSQLLV